MINFIGNFNVTPSLPKNLEPLREIASNIFWSWNVDAVGLSILSGAHMALVPRVLELLKANGQEHVKVFLGGIIPDQDMPRLLEIGITGVYGPGTPTDQIIQDIHRAVQTTS